MRRREFIAALGGVAAWPLTARAQQAGMPVVGFLHSAAPGPNEKRLEMFRKGLAEAGFVEGKSVTIEYRWAAGQMEKLAGMAADLVRRRVSAIVTAGSTPAALAAKAATSAVPIVFAIGADPVSLGLAASLNRPGGNATGAVSLNADISAKRLGLLREMLPKVSRFLAVANPTSPLSRFATQSLEDGASGLGVRIEKVEASTADDIDSVFGNLPKPSESVLIFAPDPLFYSRRAQIAALAVQRKVPTMFDVRDYAEAGGLVSYGADFFSLMQIAGDYTGRILKGEQPAALPIAQPTKFELVLNLKTAKALDLDIPDRVLAIADDVIE